MLKLTRRSFLTGTAAVAAVALAGVQSDVPEYVRFPESEWDKTWEDDFWRHQTVWRAGKDGEFVSYGLGCNLSAVDIVEGRSDRVVRSYNLALENTRRKYDFPAEMIARAARGERLRWYKKNGTWAVYG